MFPPSIYKYLVQTGAHHHHYHCHHYHRYRHHQYLHTKRCNDNQLKKIKLIYKYYFMSIVASYCPVKKTASLESLPQSTRCRSLQSRCSLQSSEKWEKSIHRIFNVLFPLLSSSPPSPSGFPSPHPHFLMVGMLINK